MSSNLADKNADLADKTASPQNRAFFFAVPGQLNGTKMNSMKKVSLPGFLLISILVCSCTSFENEPGNKELDTLAHIAIRLTDRPGDYKQVIIDIKEVQVNSDEKEGGWKTLDVQAGKYDLLKLTNGLDTLLGVVDLPPGNISQLRLILGEDNYVTLKSGRTVKLQTPSAQHSGLKVKVDTKLEAGFEYNILLDFDAARSIVRTGGGKYKLKPVIRSIVEVLGDVQEPGAGPGTVPGPGPGSTPGTVSPFGGIRGIVSPAASNPAIHAILGTDTVSTMVDANGRFLIGGLDGGAYKLVFDPIDGYLQEELDNVMVVAGDTTDVGTVGIGRL
jgi:hypothetical protein